MSKRQKKLNHLSWPCYDGHAMANLGSPNHVKGERREHLALHLNLHGHHPCWSGVSPCYSVSRNDSPIKNDKKPTSSPLRPSLNFQRSSIAIFTFIAGICCQQYLYE
eukprot:scaffold2957_cov57-Cyclotella_meneghiniana.AAC.5